MDGYRLLQIDTVVTNHGSTPVDGAVKPARWIITDGKTDSVSDLVWEWGPASTGTVMRTVSQGGVEQKVPFEVETRGPHSTGMTSRWTARGLPRYLKAFEA